MTKSRGIGRRKGSGIPASGIPAKGPGWGGPARTEDNFRLITADTQPPPAHKSAGHMEAKAYREKLAKRYEEKMANSYDVAYASDNPFLHLTATKQLEDRILGQSRQVVETQTTPRSREELLAEIEAAKKAAGIE